MTVIKQVQATHGAYPINEAPKTGSNILLLIAQVQGALAEESMKKREDARAKATAARLIEGITAEIAKQNPTEVEGMKAQFEEMVKHLRGEKLNIYLEQSVSKMRSMFTDMIELKKNMEKVQKEVDGVKNESDKESKELKRLQAKLASKEKELSKYFWVPGYGGALAIEVLVLKTRVSSAAKKVEEVQEGVRARQVELDTLVSQIENKQGILVEKMFSTARELSSEAKHEEQSLKMIMESALQSINAMTGG